MNVCLYCKGADRWAMTERGRNSLDRSMDRLQIGPSAMHWRDGELIVEVDEIAIPRPPSQFLPERLQGTIRVSADLLFDNAMQLDHQGLHFWRPVAPIARVAVDLGKGKGRQWSGHAYLDSNWGNEPLERGFARWDWARGILRDDSAVVLYHAETANSEVRNLGLRFGKSGAMEMFDPPPDANLGRGFWGVNRKIGSDQSQSPVLLRTLEDSPFYVRSLVETSLHGESVKMIHESFSGTRFASPIVKAMLPFRMPRRGR